MWQLCCVICLLLYTRVTLLRLLLSTLWADKVIVQNKLVRSQFRLFVYIAGVSMDIECIWWPDHQNLELAVTHMREPASWPQPLRDVCYIPSHGRSGGFRIPGSDHPCLGYFRCFCRYSQTMVWVFVILLTHGKIRIGFKSILDGTLNSAHLSLTTMERSDQNPLGPWWGLIGQLEVTPN